MSWAPNVNCNKNSKTMKVKKIDLFGDWVGIVKKELQAKGYQIISTDLDEISIQYFNHKKRSIPPKRRNVLKSDIFTCPSDLAGALAILEQKIASGEELGSHLSRKLRFLEETDSLLYDWGIFHLHLGTSLEADGYVTRTGPLLFGYFDEDNFYLLNVMPHGSWTKQDMLKTIHRNWPLSLERYRIKDPNVVGMEFNFTDDEVGKLRKASLNKAIEVESGVVYIAPGGGFVSSGHSTEVIIMHDRNKEDLLHLQNQIESDPRGFLSCLGNEISFVTNPYLEFELAKRGNRHHLVEKNNGFSIPLNK